MRYYIFAIILYFSMLSGANAWSPCMPFCDASCAGQAVAEMNIKTSKKLVELGKTNGELGKVLADVNQSIIELQKDQFEALNQQKEDLVKGFGNGAMAIEGEITKSFENLTNLQTSMLANMTNTITETLALEHELINVSMHGQLSSPELNANWTGALGDRYILKISNQIQQSFESKISAIGSYSPIESSGVRRIERIDLVTTKRDEGALSNVILKDNLSEDEANTASDIFFWMLYKTNELQDRTKTFTDSITTRRNLAVKSIIFSAFAKIASDKTEAGNGGLSKKQMFKESIDYLQSPTFTQNVGTLNTTGLLRALTLLKQQETALYYLLLERKEIGNKLIALDIII
jgi:hypothetical protein